MTKTKPHIFLCGFMGSGKSTAGKKLAAVLAYDFVDLDAYIEIQTQGSISRLFALQGESAFRNLEKNALKALCEKTTPTVIALGGGSIGEPAQLQLVKKNGCLIYLEMTAQALFSRLKNGAAQRPLLAGLGDLAMQEKIESLLEARQAQYRQADILVSGLNLNVHHLADQLREMYQL